jgi:hypothetical protein
MKGIVIAIVLAVVGVAIVLAARAVDLVGILRRMHGQ